MVSPYPKHWSFYNHTEKQDSVLVYRNFKKHKALKFIEQKKNMKVSWVFHMQIAKYKFRSSFQFSSGKSSMNKSSNLSHSIFESENLLRKEREICSFEIGFSPFGMLCLHQLLPLQEHLMTLTPGWISSYTVVMLLWI